MLGFMIRFVAGSLLFFLTGIAPGLQTVALNHVRSRTQWDAAHGTELSWRDSVGSSKILSDSDRAALIRAIEGKLRPSAGDLGVSTEKEFAHMASATRIKVVDLNGDGIPEVIAQSMGTDTCGAVGNCALWVFKKTASGYSSILDSGSQSFVVEATRSNGYSDLTLALHDSATRKQLYLFRFRSGRYRETACFDANWSPEINGPVLKHPVITRCER